MEVGRKYRVKPEMITGKDGIVYPVFTIHASGRGWSERNHYTPGAGVECQLEVEVLPHDGYTGGYAKAVKCKLLKGGELKMYRFAKKPYVRKDGSFNVIQGDYLTGTSKFCGDDGKDLSFKNAYGLGFGGVGEGYFHLSKDQVELI